MIPSDKFVCAYFVNLFDGKDALCLYFSVSKLFYRFPVYGLSLPLLSFSRTKSSVFRQNIRVLLRDLLTALLLTERVSVHDLKLLRFDHSIMRLAPID